MNLYQRLIKVQDELKAPKNQYNSFGKYNYRSCEDILEAAKPLCIANGLFLSISDEVKCIGEKNYVEATARVIDIESGESHCVTASAREAETKKGMDDSQITGSTSSYARKYALNGLFCIDDTKDADTDEHKHQSNNTTGQQSNSGDHPTEAQVKRLQAIAYSKGYDFKAVAKAINKKFGVDSPSQLNMAQYNQMVEGYEKTPHKKEKTRQNGGEVYGSSNADIAFESGLHENGF